MAIDKALYELPQGLAGIPEGPPVEIEIEDPESVKINIDGLEIHEPYIDKFNLRSIYNKVMVGNILAFDVSPYDYIILGDVLEHIPKYEAINLVAKINSAGKKCLIAVPYLYEQGEYDGNVHEIHHQPDLTNEIFLERYPSMHLLYKDAGYGYYINY